MGNKMLILGILTTIAGVFMGGYLSIVMPFWIGIGMTAIAVLRKLRAKHKAMIYQGG